jgi:hypothetical protein
MMFSVAIFPQYFDCKTPMMHIPETKQPFETAHRPMHCNNSKNFNKRDLFVFPGILFCSGVVERSDESLK